VTLPATFWLAGQSKVAKLPKMMKPDTGGEATGKSTCRAFRGGWGQRAGKDPLRNLGDPAAQGVATLAGSPEETITRELALAGSRRGP